MLLSPFVYLQCAFMSLRTSVRRQAGQGLVEYALIIGLIAVVLIIVLGVMSDSLGNVFTGISTELDTIATPVPTATPVP